MAQRVDQANLPEGTVTFLFTDIEGSTRLLQNLGERYAEVLMNHRRVLREVFDRNSGSEFGAEGDAFFVAFASANQAAVAAQEGQAALADGPVRVRMGIHTGRPLVVEGDYVGIDVHRAARICAAAHGGQVVLSDATGSMLGDEFKLVDLGLHRLKDLPDPEKLFQLADGEFPPLRSFNATNLPAESDPLVGRERELNELHGLVKEHRLVTLTGPGGSGKTRLGLQVAAALLEQFNDGIFWVPLATVHDPELALPVIAEALRTQVSLEDHIGEKHMLLLLDNLEQLLVGAPQLSQILRRCRNLHLLVTSRAPLRVEGEFEYEVAPLTEGDAVALFAQRAQISESADLILDICNRVDRLPLAIELAAAKTRVFSREQLLQRLSARLTLLTGGRRDLPHRHRTLRSTIEWSYELLLPPEQELFVRLAVFAGSFDLEAAEAVSAASVDLLEQLIDQSLLRQRDGRFSMLETIHEFGLERLNSSGHSDEFSERHANYYLSIAERIANKLHGTDVGDTLRRLAIDHDNFRASLTWTTSRGLVQESLRLCVALTGLWELNSHLEEGARWFELALNLRGPTDLRLRATALRECGRLLLFANRRATALSRLEESVDLARRLDDADGLSAALRSLGGALVSEDLGAARSVLEEALDLSTKAGDRPAQRHAFHLLGEALRDAGDWNTGGEFLEKSIAISRELGAPLFIGQTTHSLADLELDRRNLERAKALYRDCLRNAVECSLVRHKVYCVAGLAAVAALQGLDDLALRLWQAVQATEQALDFRLLASERRRYEQVLEGPRSQNNSLSLEEAVVLALRYPD